MTIRTSKHEHIDELVCSALNMLDCQDLTSDQRATAEQIYELCNQLELSIDQFEEKSHEKSDHQK